MDDQPAEFDEFEPADEATAADELLLADDGSGVLVFAEEDDVEEYVLGASLAEGLAHILVVDENDGDATGALTATLTEDAFTAAGDLTTEQPPELEQLDLEVVGEQTAEDSSFDAELSAVLGQANTGDTQQLSTQAGAFFDSASTQGEITVGPDSFSATGDADVDVGQMFADDSPDERFTLELTEISDGYELAISERQVRMDSAFEDPVDDWGTEEAAQATLEEQYADEADDLGGEVTVEIEHFAFEERDDGSYWSELDYTVTYHGIEDGLADALAEEFAADPATDLTADDAERIAAEATAVTIDTFEFELLEADGSLSASWNVDIQDYDGLLEAVAELDDFAQDEAFAEEFGEYEDRLAAQAAADLQSTLEWELTATSTDTQQIEIDGEASSQSENYQAYVDELADRGIDVSEEEMRYSISAVTEDDEILIEGDVEIGMEDFAETVATAALQDLEDEAAEFSGVTDAISETDFEIAKMEIDVSSETVSFEAGASFSGGESVLDDSSITDSILVTEVVGEQAGDEVVTYVSIEDPDGAALSTDELRDLDLLDDETTVFEPGEHDREVPAMDVDRATAFLDDDGGDGMPGFGVGLAIAGIVGLLFVVTRRP